MKRFIVILACVVAVPQSAAQDIRPEDVGFRSITIETDSGAVEVYVSTAGRPADTLQARPLVIYLQGSGYDPIFSGSRDRLSHTLMLKPHDFAEHHYAVIGKPAAPFWFHEPGAPPAAYHEALTLSRRVADASAAIDFLASQPWIDASQILVVGHSEGAQVAPVLAATNNRITHVAALAASGLSQAFDFVLEVRRKVWTGELSFEDGEAEIASLHDQYRRIATSPMAADSLWEGHSYRRWSSFFKSPLESFLALNIPVFVAVGVYDKASPIESADYLQIAFIQAGKENLTYMTWPTNHRFQETAPTGEMTDRRPDVLAALFDWLGR